MKKSSMLLALILCLTLGAAQGGQDPAGTVQPLRILALKGPTGMGMAPLIAQADPAYRFTLAAAPEELTGSIVSGNFDLAAVPTNLAALLYQKTKGAVQMLAINTLGVLYILEKGDSVQGVGDLSGKTILASGQGATPEYALQYILAANGITDARIEYKSEHNEVSALAASGKADIVLLPQPMVTALLMKDPGFRIAIDVTEAFSGAAALQGEPEALLSMGCLIVRKAFAEENPQAVADFLAAYRQSVDQVNTDPAAAAKDIVAAGILPNEEIARQAIPLCNIVYVDGPDMQRQLAPLFRILFEANPASVGGQLPDEGFYWTYPENG
ncbi:MAG: ABC transporter substrate-binding protein [Christensenellales bacterium]